MAEYIEREETVRTAITAITDFLGFTDSITLVRIASRIREIPTADVVEVVHGEWEFHKGGSGTCNQCHITQKNVWDYDSWQNYCGHCGAKMDGERRCEE